MVQFRKRKSDGQSFPVGSGSKLRANNPSNDVGGIKIGSGIKKILDPDTDEGRKKIAEIVDIETEKRVEKVSLDQDAYETLLNSGTDDIEGMGTSEEAGSFLRRNDPSAFRTALHDYADGISPDIRRELEEVIDEDETLKQGKYVSF